MNIPQENHFEHDRIDKLRCINGVNFTAREIDIIACLFNARGTSRTASLLNISPRTVENHVRNLMVKLGCNSREGIIDYIEKNNKHSLFRDHYAHLILGQNFKNTLRAIGKKIANSFSFSLVYWKENKNNYALLEKIKKYLERAGLTIHLEQSENPFSITQLIDEIKEGKHKIYILPDEIWDDVKNIPSLEENSLNHKQTPPNSAFLFMGKKEIHEIPHTIGGVRCVDFSKPNNYYFPIFEVLRALFPQIDLEDEINDFKNRPKFTQTHVDITTTQPAIDSQHSLSSVPIKNSIFKERKFQLFFTLIAAIAIFCLGTLIFTEKKENQGESSIRSDLPLPRDKMLLKRPELIAEIDNKFKGRTGIVTVAIVGIGGAGKTTLAHHYAHQHKANVVWEINAETRSTLNESFEKLARALSKTNEDKRTLRALLDIKDFSEKKEQLINYIKERLKLQSWFLIFDNVESLSDIQEYFPQDIKNWGQGKVLLTTRNMNISNSNFVNYIISMDELTPQQKQELLTKIMKSETAHISEEEIKAFLQRIPSYPLDISVAAYYLKTTNTSYRQYMEHLNKQDENFIFAQENLLKEAGEYIKTRHAIISLSLKKIIEAHKDFEDLLFFISFLNSQNIPKELLSSYKKDTIVDNFIFSLKKYSLITREDLLSQDFSLHRSTQKIISQYLIKNLNLQKKNDLIQSIDKVMEKYTNNYLEKDDVKKMHLILPHITSLLAKEDLITDFTRANLGVQLGHIHRRVTHDYLKAKSLLDKSLSIYLQKYKNNHSKIAWALAQLGLVYRSIGSLQLEQQFLEKSLYAYKQSHDNDKKLAWLYVHLSLLHKRLGNYQDAEILLNKSLKIYKKHSGGESVEVAWALGNLGFFYRILGKNDDARKLIENSLSIQKKEYGETHPEIGLLLVNLGMTYKNLGHYEKAQILIQKGLETYQTYHSNDNLNISWATICLGKIYGKMGDWLLAKKLIEKSLSMSEDDNNPMRMAWKKGQLGIVYRELGDYPKAIFLLQQSFKHYKEFYDENSLENSWIFYNLGKTYFLQNDLEKAELYYNRALKGFQYNQHPNIYKVLEGLADLAFQKYKNTIPTNSQIFKAQSINFLQKALEIIKTNFSKDSPHFASIENKLKNLEQEGY